VGLTVLFASITLAILTFLMTGATGMFTKKIILKAYVDNAEGLRQGAPVRLQGVDIGNVTRITVVPDHQPTPVEVTMKVSTKYASNLRKDSTARLRTAGVLGETFVDVTSIGSKGPEAQNGDVLKTMETAGIEDVVRSSQSTLENTNILLKRIDRIVSFVESGEGSIGKLIYDEDLYRRMNTTLREVQTMVAAVSQGKGSVGKLINDDELYNKANASVDKLNSLIDQVNQGQGTVGKFMKDPSLYNNANQTIAHANRLMADINAGKGALGKFASDEAFARKLDNTLTKFSLLADRMEAGDGTAGRILKDPALYNNADQMLVETRSLIKAIRENPKRYLTIHFRIF
jgi:phospholipid/cholesterol/gamma-HCH transport system substrate-binding protein